MFKVKDISSIEIMTIGLTLLVVYMFVLAFFQTPNEQQIQAACSNIKKLPEYRAKHVEFMNQCLQNSSKRLATHEDNEAEFVAECRDTAANVYPTEDYQLPWVASNRVLSNDAYRAAREQGCNE